MSIAFNGLIHLLTLQLAISTIQPSSLKRNAPQEFDDHDSENIDPSIFLSANKKSKNIDLDLVKPNKATHYVLTNSLSTPSAINRPIITPAKLQKRKVEVPSTPVIPDRSPKIRHVGPSSAPTVAGRSPKSKRIGILSRRRVSSSPFTRVDPPSFSKGGSRTALPFSLDAALSGTVSSYKPAQPVEVPTLEESGPKSWMFDIYQDTEEKEAENLMNHYTCTLDISSDDESRAAAKDDRGKENIPPTDGVVYSSAALVTARVDMMTDEARSPLGTLDAKDFYAEGCDASSYIIIPAEKEVDQCNEKVAPATECNEASSIQPTTVPEVAHTDGWQELLAQVEQSKNDANDVINCSTDIQETSSHQPEIEIWESESAKGDNDIVVQDLSRPGTLVHALQPATGIMDGACFATSA